jgi:hypothetical protein
VNPLLADPTDQQACLLDVVYGGRESAGWPNFERAESARRMEMRRVGKPGDWPIFQYVEAVLYREHGLDARTVLLECPSLRFRGNVGRYGWLDFQKPDANVLAPDDKVGLNVAGMTRLPRAAAEVEVFLDVLAFLVERERAFVPSPSIVQKVELSAVEVQQRLEPPHGRWLVGEAELSSIRAMLEREPSTWNCQLEAPEESAGWTASLSPFIRRYAGIRTADEYVDRMVQLIAPPSSVPEPFYPSSLSLPEAIDYLNAVWRTHAGKPLFTIARAEAAAKLALDCATADELDGRLSALCGILGHLQLPDSEDNRKLVDLKTYLAQQLAGEAVARVETAVDDLRAFFGLRAWRQHPGADERGRQAMRHLEVELPTSDWEGAWRHLQARAVAALAVLREEIDALG